MSAASSTEAAPVALPGFPEINVLFHGHRRHDGQVWIWVTYSGWPKDLIAAGVMSKAWLQPTGKHLRDAEGDKASVTRSWRLRGSKPQRWCQVLRAKPVERLDSLPGARAAVLAYLRREAEREWPEGGTTEYRAQRRAFRASVEASLRELGRAIMPAALMELIDRTEQRA